MRNEQRKLETDDDDDDDSPKLKITNEEVKLDPLDIHVIGEPEIELLPDLLIDDVEVLA